MIRNLDEEKLNQLMAQQTEKPLLGIFGTEKINLLKLNIALDKFKLTILINENNNFIECIRLRLI